MEICRKTLLCYYNRNNQLCCSNRIFPSSLRPRAVLFFTSQCFMLSACGFLHSTRSSCRCSWCRCAFSITNTRVGPKESWPWRSSTPSIWPGNYLLYCRMSSNESQIKLINKNFATCLSKICAAFR